MCVNVHFVKLHKTCVIAQKMFNALNKIFKAWMSTRKCNHILAVINEYMFAELFLSGIKMELRMLYVGFITAVVSRTLLFFFSDIVI